MLLEWEFGSMTDEMQSLVNRRLRDGWHLLGPPIVEIRENEGRIPYAVFVFCDESPYEQWLGGENGMQRSDFTMVG